MTDPTTLCRDCRHVRGEGLLPRCGALGLFALTARFTACDQGQFFERKPNTLEKVAEYLGMA